MGIKTKLFNLNQIYIAANNIAMGEENYYLYTAKPLQWPDEETPPAVFNSVQDSVFDTQQSLLFGKKIDATNLRMMVKRYDWTVNTKFDQYSHIDSDLYDKRFFCVTDERKVYKVLYNAQNKPSTVKPTLTQNNAFTTSDGYVWKYMYQLTTADMDNFGTPSHIPVSTDANTVNSAKSGIDVIELTSSGQGYLCYVNGTVQSVVTDKIVQIDNYASQDNDFYTRSAFYVTSGPAMGQLRTITRYVSNTTGNFVQLDNSIGVIPILTKYRIAPGVKIVGDGRGAQAICDVSETYGIKDVRVISTGIGYTRAKAVISTNTAYGAGASVIAFVPPPGGHGSFPSYELGADTFGINMIFNKNDANTIPASVSFRRYGVMKNPKDFTGAKYEANTFSNVMTITTSPALTFKVGEHVTTGTTLSEADVIASNSTATLLIGDKTFANSENIFAANGFSVTINSVKQGDINPATAEILYINNTSPVTRTATGNETVKILFKF